MAQFAALDTDEREFWLRWEVRRRERINTIMRELRRQDKVYADQIMVQLLTHLLRNG